MVRFGLVAALVTIFVFAVSLTRTTADPAAEEAAFKAHLAVQRAMEQGKYLLSIADHQKAVQVLEEHVARINGNAEYLRLLRQAYRGYVRDLVLARQDEQAGKYRARLAILDGAAATDPALKPGATTSAAVLLPPTTAGVAANTPVKKLRPPKPSPPPATARGKADDPFDPANQRLTKDQAERQKLAQAHLLQALTEYEKKSYAQARLYFEQAHQLDAQAAAGRRDLWAYCKLAYVIEQLDRPTVEAGVLADLTREVHSAMVMAPTPGMTQKGKELLDVLEERGRNPKSAQAPAARDGKYTITHHSGADARGWSFTETTHFRIYHKQSKDYVEKVALVAERTRYDMYRKWFGNAGPEWEPKCEVYLHPTAQDYAQATGVPAASPGHAKLETENGTGRVVARRLEMRCDNPTMLDAVLPHEATHVVIAGQYGPFAVPRWADEGVAVLTEPDQEIEKHRKNLVRCQRDNLLFPVKKLMEMQDYPQPRYVGAFYAQSVALVDFLTRQKGPQVFSAFLTDGLKSGYEPALRKHYGWDYATLQQQWNQQLAAEVSRLSPSVAGR